MHDDVKSFFAAAELAGNRAVHKTTDKGHRRIEERTWRATDAIDWLKELHFEGQNLRGIAAITSTRIDKKTGLVSMETRFYINSLPADAAPILAARRAHWGIENNLHWQLDVTFDEDRCRTRKDFSPLNLANVRHMVFNVLKRERLKACVSPTFRAGLLAC